MLKLGKQILHTLVLLITGMALIGVNVTQSGCIHSDRTYLEVRVLPAENTCPCEEGCGCCQEERQFCKDCCHASFRHDFYKVTDSSLVERVLQMQLSVFTLPECGWEMTMQILAVRTERMALLFTGSFPGFRPHWNRCVLFFVKTFCRSVLTMDLDKVCCHF